MKSDNSFIFDFNGTLFWDTLENEVTWSKTYEHYRGYSVSKEEFHNLNGKTDRATSLYILGPEASEEELFACEMYKETMYKELCLEHNLTLVDVAEEFLSEIKESGDKLSIASSAPKFNMDWYIPELGLLRFFEKKNIIAGRTDIKGKPAPDIFLLAAREMGVSIESCIIFEDSLSGLKAARDSGARLVVKVKSSGSNSNIPTSLYDIEIESFNDPILKTLI